MQRIEKVHSSDVPNARKSNIALLRICAVRVYVGYFNGLSLSFMHGDRICRLYGELLISDDIDTGQGFLCFVVMISKQLEVFRMENQ